LALARPPATSTGRNGLMPQAAPIPAACNMSMTSCIVASVRLTAH